MDAIDRYPRTINATITTRCRHEVRNQSTAKNDAITVFEKEYLSDLLKRHNGNISQAARTAGIDRKTIHRMLAKYEIEGRD